MSSKSGGVCVAFVQHFSNAEALGCHFHSFLGLFLGLQDEHNFNLYAVQESESRQWGREILLGSLLRIKRTFS